MTAFFTKEARLVATSPPITEMGQATEKQSGPAKCLLKTNAAVSFGSVFVPFRLAVRRLPRSIDTIAPLPYSSLLLRYSSAPVAADTLSEGTARPGRSHSTPSMSAPPVTAALKALAQQRLSEATDRANLRSLGGGCFVDVAFAQILRRFKQIIDLDLSGMELFSRHFSIRFCLVCYFCPMRHSNVYRSP